MPSVADKPKLKAVAFFHVAYGEEAIDKDAGILRGVKLMEIGKLASFGGPDGKSKSVTIADAHISALLGHAGNRAIPIHLTHDWHDSQGKPNADTIEMSARIGSLKTIRRDATGNLVADAYLKEGQTRSDILFGAEHNPEDTMFSVVFSYDPADANCLPLNFRCADIVPQGAATTALFSETQTTAKMALTLDDLKELLSTPEGAAYMGGILKAHGKMKKDAAADAGDDGASDSSSDSAPAATAAALKKFKDDLTAEFETKKTALLAEVETKAQAAATALLGKGGYTQSGGGGQADDAEAKLAAYMAPGNISRGTAIMRFAHDKPEEYNAARAAGKL